MLSRLARVLVSQSQRRALSSVSTVGTSSSTNASKLIFSSTAWQSSGADISQVNTRLDNLSLMGAYYSGKPLLQLPSDNSSKPKDCPTTTSVEVKKFIVEKPVAVKEPEVMKKQISDPVKRVKKHAIRMLVLRHKKMKKHQLKRLWDRMYLRFRAKRIRLEKNKELEFRGRLSVKVADARKFDAEKYVEDYLNDYHTPLIPKTYEGELCCV